MTYHEITITNINNFMTYHEITITNINNFMTINKNFHKGGVWSKQLTIATQSPTPKHPVKH